MTAELDAAGRSKDKLMGFLSRSRCHPCDRSEAGHQLSLINKKIDTLTTKMNFYAVHSST